MGQIGLYNIIHLQIACHKFLIRIICTNSSCGRVTWRTPISKVQHFPGLYDPHPSHELWAPLLVPWCQPAHRRRKHQFCPEFRGANQLISNIFWGLPSITGNACRLSTYSVCTVFGHGTSTAIAVDCSESKPSASLNLNWSSRMILDDFGFPFSVLLILSKLVMTLRPSPCIVDHCPWLENQREGSPIPTELKIKCMVIRDSCSTSENP